jgi:phosphomannomutase
MKEMMRKKKANLGMERSGHYYFREFFNCDSGIFVALQMINFVGGARERISEYANSLPKYYQIPETNFRLPVSEDGNELKKKLEKIKNLYKDRAIRVSENDGLLMEFGDWWMSLRLSNSENLLRLNMEAVNEKILDFQYKKIKKILPR